MRSSLIVALQFTLIATVALPLGGGEWTAAAGTLVAAGVAVGAWALSANHPGNFNIRPDPKPGGRLVTSGPYAFVRHPMYLALMLAMPGFCLARGGLWRWLALAALALVLGVKMRIEEDAMAARHPGYSRYARATRRIVPFVW